MKKFLKLSLIIVTTALTVSHAYAAQTRVCPLAWKGTNENDCDFKEFVVPTWSNISGKKWDVKAKIRSGYLPENPDVLFRGNIIYYEGLGDSMLNHMPLFQKLTQQGYRVIAFDYMGQGGSSGSMNDTRILQIANLGDKVWSLYARDLVNYPKKTILGWSTGGLAAYMQAVMQTDVDNIILIAPGIAPNLKVGEQHPFELQFNLITLATLTSQVYSDDVENPHLDPIRPNSPLKVMDFSWDLIITSFKSRCTPINSQVNGFVLLSGDDDTYVNAEKTFYTLQNIAPHFVVKQYPNTLHEIDNETDPNRSSAHSDILNFLNAHI